MDIDMGTYRERGYGILNNVFSEADCRRLREQAHKIVTESDHRSRSIFSTRDESQNRDAYFLESAEKVRCFFEEEAFAPDGGPKYPIENCINKIGHALHDHDPVFSAFSFGDTIRTLAQAIADYKDPRILQSMYIFKQPYIGGEVTCHQDSSFVDTSEPSLMAIWIALEDATEENGCLWGIPGGHREPLRSLYVRENQGAALKTLDPTPFDLKQAIPLPLKAGSVLFFDGFFPHFSYPNRSEKSRQAYVLHLIDPTKPYPRTNWLQRQNPLRPFNPARRILYRMQNPPFPSARPPAVRDLPAVCTDLCIPQGDPLRPEAEG